MMETSPPFEDLGALARLNGYPAVMCDGSRYRLPGPVLLVERAGRRLSITCELHDPHAGQRLATAMFNTGRLRLQPFADTLERDHGIVVDTNPMRAAVGRWTISTLEGAWLAKTAEGGVRNGVGVLLLEFIELAPAPVPRAPRASSRRESNRAAAVRAAQAPPSWAYRVGWQSAIAALGEHCNARDLPFDFAEVFSPVLAVLFAYHQARLTGSTRDAARKVAVSWCRVPEAPGLEAAIDAYERCWPGPAGLLVMSASAT